MISNSFCQNICAFIELMKQQGDALWFNAGQMVDLLDLSCPEPLMMLRQTMRKVEPGQFLIILATDPSTERDIQNYCRFTGQELHLSMSHPYEDGEYGRVYGYVIQKNQ